MPKEQTIKGKRCRVYSSGYTWIWVADTGDFVSHYEKGGRYKGSCRILKDHCGPFVKGTYGGMVYLEKAVITCFCPPCPNDGKKYMINHKDGNWMNCHYKNLEWAPYHYRNTTVPKVRLYTGKEFLEVFSDGTIKSDGQEKSVIDYWYDSDMDLHWITPSPYIILGSGIHGNRVEVGEIMKKCGYIQGDDADLTNPVILHRDFDYKNYASDNLEWTEADDPRYLDYLEKRHNDMEARSNYMNGDKPRPKGWI